DPTNAIPYLEKDDAIIRGVTTSFVDFSNVQSYTGGTSAPAAGALVTSLTSDGQTGAANAAFSPVSGGLLECGGTASNRFWNLPANFKLASTCKRFMFICWVKLPASGYQTASSNVTQVIAGVMGNTSSLAQWGLYLTTIQATGLPDKLSYITPNSANALFRQLSNADTMAVCDGNLHQIAIYFDGESLAGSLNRYLYVD